MAHSALNFFYFEDFSMKSHIKTVFNQISAINTMFREKKFHCSILAPQKFLGFHPCKSPRLKNLPDVSVVRSNTCIQCRKSVPLWYRSHDFPFAGSPSPSLTIGLFLSDVVKKVRNLAMKSKVGPLIPCTSFRKIS